MDDFDVEIKIRILEHSIRGLQDSINNRITDKEILSNYVILLNSEFKELREYKEKYPEYFL